MSVAPTLGSPLPAPPRAWRATVDAALVVTWALMVLGALTRASLAGLSCPDWPLCHGHLVPPLEASAYPPIPDYEVHKVYLEFLHRVLAAVASGFALLVAVAAWRRSLRGAALSLVGILGLQVLVGAMTVWLGNAPYTVVLHMALALAFLAVLLVLRRRMAAAADAPRRSRRWALAWTALAALAAVQMLVGAAVSSQYFGLACGDFPLCDDGRLWPAQWTDGTRWQLLHRGLGALLLLGLAIAGLEAWRARDAHDRGAAALLATMLVLEILLGGVNVWLQIPPWASALHLGVAVVVFAALATRAADGLSQARAAPAR